MLSRREKILYVDFSSPTKITDRKVLPGDDKFVIANKEGELITLDEHKRLYPYQLDNDITVEVVTSVRVISFTIPAGYVWNGADIPKLLWPAVGSQHNPEFKDASMVHDYMLEFKWDIYKPPLSLEISIADYRRLTSLIFRQILKNVGVPTIKANIMSGAVQFFQAVFNRKQWKQEEKHED